MRRMLIAAVVTVAVLGACGGGDESSSRRPAEDFDRNLERWALPLDTYHPDSAYAEARHLYAENLLVSACLAEEGVTYPAFSAPTAASTSSAAVNDAGRRLFTPDIAATYGYHSAPRDDGSAAPSAEDSAAQRAFSEQVAADPGVQEAFEGCLSEARDEVPYPNINLIESLETSAYQAAKVDREAQSAAERWQTCLDPQGVADLPELPDDGMPPTELAADFGLADADGDAFAAPGVEEIQLAEADAECRESSGLTEALYDAEFDAQVAFIADNEDALERIRATVQQSEENVDAVIAENE